jgi:hypothetical protein
MSILGPTTSAYTFQEPSRLSTTDESTLWVSRHQLSLPFPQDLVTFSNDNSNCIYVSLCIISDSPSLPPLQVPSSTMVVTMPLSPRPTSIILTRTPFTRFDGFLRLHEDRHHSQCGAIAVIHADFERSGFATGLNITPHISPHRHMFLYPGCHQYRPLAHSPSHTISVILYLSHFTSYPEKRV